MLARLNLFFLNEQLKSLGLSAGQVPYLAELLQNRAPLTQDEISLSLAVDPGSHSQNRGSSDKKRAGPPAGKP